ncbi:MAG: YqeG family HAD IIIA-type phosphatase [Acholeplasmatales bacterium]|nr:YqeG family HAD IIIA-type phosphatase [Acholeplasmatales bacterium]
MLERFINYKKVIPEEYKDSIYDIDYKALYESGKRIVFFDLDNTLISYKEEHATDEIKAFVRSLEEIGYEVMIVSNSRKKRVKVVADELNVKFSSLALKPTKIGFKRALRKASRKYSKEEILEVGDQLLTDVYGSRRCGFYTILVRAIDHKTERKITRINRNRERKILARIKERDIAAYIEKLQKYESENL